MTYQAALGLSEEAQQPFFQRLIGTISGFFNCLAIRLIFSFVIGTVAVALVADAIYPKLMTGFANQLVVELADSAKKKTPQPARIMQMINQYNLSWCYVTTTDAKIVPSTKPYAPELSKYDITPRELDWKGKHYYESVSHIAEDQVLHIGVYAGPVIIPCLTQGASALTVPVSLGYLLFFTSGLLFLTLLLLQMWVSKPLAHLSRASYSLLLTREAYSHVTGGGLSVPGAVTEVQNVSKGLRDIRRQYDDAVAARTAKDEELKRERSEHAEEKNFISKQYEEQLATTQEKLTELHTKEAEEEFLNSLSRELDNLKSSKQLYHRVLEKLNDKFPTSIIFGAFYKSSKNMESTIEAWLGFDERSIQALKRVDHLSIARHIFSTGNSQVIGQAALRDYGFQQIAQANSIRSIVYLPVRFQNRNLGMLAFYFVQEGQVVQERLRILRNVVDLASRALYQVVMFEEETEAARTDPMTGLRNKKFFYEIMPHVFERASTNPEQNPISLIMIDGDHFKSVNDTYGHQVGDLMLQELAKVIKQCVRTSDGLEKTSGPGDYLIRYGGEEFVVVMECTDAKRGCAVAERIREAVESKADWPGGIAKWTVSLGVSTYPVDGKGAEDLMEKADTALYYVKEELGRNKSCHTQQVPRAFKAKKKAAAIGGELGVFDAAGLLQSIATSQKTGVLTVQSTDGKNLWMLWEAGKPIQSRLGKQQGNAAITEFLVTFEDGSFNFQERSSSGRDTKLPILDPSFNVTRPLDSCLMNSALAVDNYNLSRTVVSTTEILIRAVPQEELNDRWNALGQLEDPPTQDEFHAMTELVKRADGATKLTNIFKQLETAGMPTHLMWRAAALLVQHGLVQTKPV